MTDRNRRILQELRSISDETGLKMSELSLAWLLANPAVTAPIIGASRMEQLEENIEVVDHRVSANMLERISEVSKPDWLHRREEQEARRQAFQKERVKYWRESRSS